MRKILVTRIIKEADKVGSRVKKEGFQGEYKPIGELLLNDDVIIPFDSVFSLAGIIRKQHKEGDISIIDDFELTEIQLSSDDAYEKYLDSKMERGVLPPANRGETFDKP